MFFFYLFFLILLKRNEVPTKLKRKLLFLFSIVIYVILLICVIKPYFVNYAVHRIKLNKFIAKIIVYFVQMFQVIGLTKQVDMTERQIERWWRYRRAQDKPSTLMKFCENSWRCMYYTYSFGYGVFILWDKPWFWEVKSCWYGYPHQVNAHFCHQFE